MPTSLSHLVHIQELLVGQRLQTWLLPAGQSEHVRHESTPTIAFCRLLGFSSRQPFVFAGQGLLGRTLCNISADRMQKSPGAEPHRSYMLVLPVLHSHTSMGLLDPDGAPWSFCQKLEGLGKCGIVPT